MTRPLIGPDWATNTNFSAGARPWNGQPNKTQPSAGVIAEGFDPENPFFADFVNWILNNHGNWLKSIDIDAALGVFGSGADGDSVLDGTAAAPAWATKSSAIYTMVRDANPGALTVTGAGTQLKTNGFRLWGNSLTTAAGAVVSNNGGAGQGANTPVVGGGTGGATGSTIGGQNGANGAGAANGVSGVNAINSLGGNGGAGHSGSGGSGGAAGTATPPVAALGRSGASFGQWMGHLIGIAAGISAVTALEGGASGGSGAGDGANAGGGGGGGGGTMCLSFRSINLATAADLQVAGGAGGFASSSFPNVGCGGGGGGGYMRVVTRALTIASGTMSAAVNCPGGAGGVSTNTPANNGAPGANGTLELISGGPGAAIPFASTHEESGNISVASGDTNKTATFSTPFSIAPPSGGGYKFDFAIARTDGILATPGVIIITLTTTSMTFQIIDDFQGVLSWHAWV